MVDIERNSPVPLYHQLKQLLANRIANGEWQPGDMLPTEEQLQEQYGLSRTTVRQALQELEYEDKISRHRGRGTFVSQPKLRHSPDPYFNLTAYLTQQGMRPGWRVLSAGWVPASTEVAERLALKPETPVFRLRRLRLANDEPIGYHIAHSAPGPAASIEDSKFDQGGSLDYLYENNERKGSYADRTIEAILATEEMAKLLGVVEGSPLLLIQRRLFDDRGMPVEEMRAMYRGDRFQYHVRWQPPD